MRHHSTQVQIAPSTLPLTEPHRFTILIGIQIGSGQALIAVKEICKIGQFLEALKEKGVAACQVAKPDGLGWWKALAEMDRSDFEVLAGETIPEETLNGEKNFNETALWLSVLRLENKDRVFEWLKNLGGQYYTLPTLSEEY